VEKPSNKPVAIPAQKLWIKFADKLPTGDPEDCRLLTGVDIQPESHRIYLIYL